MERKDIEELAKEVNLSRVTVEQIKPMMEYVQNLWDEVDQRNTTMKLDPDYKIYQELENRDMLFIYTAEYKGKISFYSFFIQPSFHVKGTKQLASDFIYVDPSHRGTGVADILLLASEDQAKKEGVRIISINLKEFDKHDSLIERLGYIHFENTYQRIL